MLDYKLGTLEASEALIKDLYLDLRNKVNAWSEITNQTPQARMGYIGQHLVSVVTGYPGGKSGARGYDLVMHDGKFGEIKTCYRVDQLGACKNCHAVVSSLESICSACGSANISRKDDSKWLIGLRNEVEFREVVDPEKYYFVLFEFEDIQNTQNNNIVASIWEVDSKTKGFAFCMVDYYMNIRAKSTSKAPFNMWPYQLKFVLTKPILIYRSVIKADGSIENKVFPSLGNTYEDELRPLTEYSGATTLEVSAIREVISLYSPKTNTSSMNKKQCLQFLEDVRRKMKISNGELCDAFADAIYLPLIVPHKKDIPFNIRKHFSEL